MGYYPDQTVRALLVVWSQGHVDLQLTDLHINIAMMGLLPQPYIDAYTDANTTQQLVVLSNVTVSRVMVSARSVKSIFFYETETAARQGHNTAINNTDDNTVISCKKPASID